MSYLKSYKLFETKVTVDGVFYAISNGDLSIVKKYIKNGGDINVVKYAKGSMLLFATSENKIEIAKYLIDNNCDLTIINGFEGNAFRISINYIYKEIFDMLIDKVDINLVFDDEEPLETAFSKIACTETNQMICALIDRGANINMVIQVFENTWILTTPLEYSIKQERIVLIKKLLEAGAILKPENIKFIKNSSIIEYIQQHRKKEYFEFLKIKTQQVFNI